MALADKTELYRQLPSVDELLGRPEAQQWLAGCPRELVLGEIRSVLDEIRRAIGQGDWDASAAAGVAPGRIESLVSERLAARKQRSLKRVINATGVILHTNLGRAPLSRPALEAIEEAARGYSNLEYDLASGKRGRRDAHADFLLERLLGAPAIVVNNNAAAVFLALHELAFGGEVVVSRGELIEIGDGFRIPEIMERSGARLREVGTTNRTRADDYRRAVGEATRLLLRVHHSNFRIIGFTARPSLEEMAALGRETGLPVMEDLGSGCLYDVAAAGLADEPPVHESLRAGVDIVTFSGDKLLGGPQAGIIAGRKDLVSRIRRNPLFRALRVDKITYAALEATLAAYLFQRYDEIPVLRMLRIPEAELQRRAERLLERLGWNAGGPAELAAGESVLGGGSTPAQGLPTTLIRIGPPAGRSVRDLEQQLRRGDPPVIARIDEDRLVIDLRTVAPEEEDELAAALRSAAQPSPPGSGG